MNHLKDEPGIIYSVEITRITYKPDFTNKDINLFHLASAIIEGVANNVF